MLILLPFRAENAAVNDGFDGVPSCTETELQFARCDMLLHHVCLFKRRLINGYVETLSQGKMVMILMICTIRLFHKQKGKTPKV